MKICVYPLQRRGEYDNGYIEDFCNSLKDAGVTIVNKPSRNPLLSLFRQGRGADCYVFHWIENVPNYKHGLIQSFLAWLLICKIKLGRAKIVWFLHNKSPHSGRHRRLSRAIMRMMAAASDLIVTHSREGVGFMAERYPHRLHKVVFLDHPTKNRLCAIEDSGDLDCDLLIWGTVAPYKNVDKFLDYASKEMPECRVRVIGRCNDSLREKLLEYENERIVIEPRSVSFEELGDIVSRSRYVLVPYSSETLLSSGTLMDSLSLGAKVIGPDTGSFADYKIERRVVVRTYSDYGDIKRILDDGKADTECDYADFLNEKSWPRFAERFLNCLQ